MAGNIIGLILIPLVIFILIVMVFYFIQKGSQKASAILFIIAIIFIYVLIFNLLEPRLDNKIYIDPDMQIFDFIWYTLMLLLIMFVSAALIHSMYISSELIAYFTSISVGITMVLILYTIMYRVYKYRESLGKIVFILTIYVILFTFIILFLNKLIPASILKLFYLLYACFIFGYVCCFVFLICRFIYNLIVHPHKFQKYTHKFNVLGKLNAGAFKILSI